MNILKFLLAGILTCIAIFQFHNARLFNPLYGLDAQGHIEYLEYLKTNKHLPLPHEGWELYQTPIYYLDTLPAYLYGGVKAVQLQNVVYYLAYLILTGYLVLKIFPKEKSARLVATLTLAALPVANYLVPMISNESLNVYLISLSLLIFMIKPYQLATVLLIVLAFYNKYTALTLGPAYLVSLVLNKAKNWSKILLYGFIFLLLTLPIFWRNYSHYQRLLPIASEFFPYQTPKKVHNLKFFTNMQWVSQVDLFRAHTHSFIGGTWNTFWHDGYQLTVPVVETHKKALGLWILGFPLFILSVIGWIKLRKSDPHVFAIGMTYLVTALGAYIYYNLRLPYDSEVKAFFMSGLPIIYTLGMTGCYHYVPKTRKIMVILLLLQFTLMISYFWIQPWWHIAK